MKAHRLKISVILNFLFIIGIFIGLFLCRDWIYERFVGKKQTKIVMYGDSLTEHGKWNYLLSRADIKNSGFGGHTTSHLLVMLDQRVLVYKPKICFLLGGINDINFGIPLPRTLKNMNSIIDKLQERNISVVLQSVLYTTDPNNSIEIEAMNDSLMVMAKQQKISFININPEISKNKLLIASFSKDGLHLTKAAYPHWAGLIKGYLAANNL